MLRVVKGRCPLLPSSRERQPRRAGGRHGYQRHPRQAGTETVRNSLLSTVRSIPCHPRTHPCAVDSTEGASGPAVRAPPSREGSDPRSSVAQGHGVVRRVPPHSANAWRDDERCRVFSSLFLQSHSTARIARRAWDSGGSRAGHRRQSSTLSGVEPSRSLTKSILDGRTNDRAWVERG